MEVAALRRAIPAAIDALGGDSRGSELRADAWAIYRGPLTGYVAMLNPEGAGDADPVVHVTFPIMRVPDTGAEPLFRRLLEVNHEQGDFACFSLDARGTVWLGAGRFAADLDEAELRSLIAEVATLAERYSDELLERFGRQLAVS